jgi:predicted transcriptional regulator
VKRMKRSQLEHKQAALRRAGTRQWVLKPQDLAIAFKLVLLQGERLPYKTLAQQMHLSQFEAHAAVQRLMAARLVVDVEGQLRPVKSALRGFVLDGAPYVYPPVRGEQTVGFPTSHGAAPLNEELVGTDQTVPVWPHPSGTVSGPALLPLYENASLAALDDPALYELLALFDALRSGQSRERELARGHLSKRLQ